MATRYTKWGDLLTALYGSMVIAIYKLLPPVTFIEATIEIEYCGYDWELSIETKFLYTPPGEHLSVEITATWDCAGCSIDEPDNRYVSLSEMQFDGFIYHETNKTFVRNPVKHVYNPIKDASTLNRFRVLFKNLKQ